MYALSKFAICRMDVIDDAMDRAKSDITEDSDPNDPDFEEFAPPDEMEG